MELTFVVAVQDMWQLQPSWLHPCQVCDQGRSVGKIKFTQNKEMVEGWVSPPLPHTHISRNFFFTKKVGNAEKSLKSRT